MGRNKEMLKAKTIAVSLINPMRMDWQRAGSFALYLLQQFDKEFWYPLKFLINEQKNFFIGDNPFLQWFFVTLEVVGTISSLI